MHRIMKRVFFTLISTLVIAQGISAQSNKVYTYPAPSGAPLKYEYNVYVQPKGSDTWTHLNTYMAKVNAPIGNYKHKISEVSYSFFDFVGDVNVRVTCKNKKFKKVRVRPDSKGIMTNMINDSTVEFVISKPENLSVEFDEDITNNLHLFTSKPTQTVAEAKKEAKRQGRKFIYIRPGYYDAKNISKLSSLLPTKDDTLFVSSNTTIYISGGAYLNADFAINDAQNVSILGRGIARPERGYEGAHVHRSTNVLIDGLILNTCPVGGSNGVTLRDVKSISFPQWGDGLNVFASSNVLYDRVFCRNSDDCTTAYATRKGFMGSVDNVRMTNSILWADVAHPIFIGLHGNPEIGDSITNLQYDNIDILCQAEPQIDYQGCLAINCGDGNFVKNVVFDDIRIEGIINGCITQVKVGWNKKYCTAAGGGIEGVLFRNISLDGPQPDLSIITGYDAQHKVRNITFEGLKINGQTISDDMPSKPRWYATADFVPMFVGSHVENLKFTK